MPTLGTTPSAVLPTGGTAGQALVKTGPGASDLGWAAAGSGGGAGPIYVSGTWYDTRYLPIDADQQNLSIGQGYVKYFPFFLPAAISIDRLGVFCRSATAGSTLNIAVHSTTDDVKPGPILASTLFTAPAANSSLTQVATATLPAGWNWFSAGVTNSTNGSWTLANANCYAFRPLLPTLLSTGYTASNYTNVNGGSGIPIFPLPTVGLEYRSEMPVFWFRIA